MVKLTDKVFFVYKCLKELFVKVKLFFKLIERYVKVFYKIILSDLRTKLVK